MLVEGIGGVAPGERVEFGLGEEVDMGVDDGVVGGLGWVFAGHCLLWLDVELRNGDGRGPQRR